MTTYLGPLSGAVLEQSAALEKQATALKKEGDWNGALAALRKVKALQGGLYQSTRLAKFLQQADRLEEALQEIQWLVDHSQQWAKTIYAHQPATVLQRVRVHWLMRVHGDAILICKRAKRLDLQAEHEQRQAEYAGLLEKLKPVAEAEKKSLVEGWARAKEIGRKAMDAFHTARKKRIERNQR